MTQQKTSKTYMNDQSPPFPNQNLNIFQLRPPSPALHAHALKHRQLRRPPACKARARIRRGATIRHLLGREVALDEVLVLDIDRGHVLDIDTNICSWSSGAASEALDDALSLRLRGSGQCNGGGLSSYARTCLGGEVGGVSQARGLLIDRYACVGVEEDIWHLPIGVWSVILHDEEGVVDEPVVEVPVGFLLAGIELAAVCGEGSLVERREEVLGVDADGLRALLPEAEGGQAEGLDAVGLDAL